MKIFLGKQLQERESYSGFPFQEVSIFSGVFVLSALASSRVKGRDACSGLKAQPAYEEAGVEG